MRNYKQHDLKRATLPILDLIFFSNFLILPRSVESFAENCPSQVFSVINLGTELNYWQISCQWGRVWKPNKEAQPVYTTVQKFAIDKDGDWIVGVIWFCW